MYGTRKSILQLDSVPVWKHFPWNFLLGGKKGKEIVKYTFAISGLYEGMTLWMAMGSKDGKVQGSDWWRGPRGVWKEDLLVCFSQVYLSQW